MVVTLVTAALAAVLHVYIFVMESVLWTTPRVRATFGITSDQQARQTKQLAFNQGFYNLFLAVIVAVGCVVVVTGAGDPVRIAVGVALIVAGTGSMLAAALVLVLSDRRKVRAAAAQGILPLTTLIALAVGAVG